MLIVFLEVFCLVNVLQIEAGKSGLNKDEQLELTHQLKRENLEKLDSKVVGTLPNFHLLSSYLNVPISVLMNAKPEVNGTLHGFIGAKPGHNKPKPSLIDSKPGGAETFPGFFEAKPGHNKPNFLDQKPEAIESFPGFFEAKPSLNKPSSNLMDVRPDLAETFPGFLEHRPGPNKPTPNLMDQKPEVIETFPGFLEFKPDPNKPKPDTTDSKPNHAQTFISQSPSLIIPNPDLFEPVMIESFNGFLEPNVYKPFSIHSQFPVAAGSNFLQTIPVPDFGSRNHPEYEFNYKVADASSGNVHSHEVKSENGVVKGVYKLNDPDGFQRIVEYEADKNGFHPKIRRVPLKNGKNL